MHTEGKYLIKLRDKERPGLYIARLFLARETDFEFSPKETAHRFSHQEATDFLNKYKDLEIRKKLEMVYR